MHCVVLRVRVVHVLWESSTYSTIRSTSVEKLRELLGSELWEYVFDDLLSLVRSML